MTAMTLHDRFLSQTEAVMGTSLFSTFLNALDEPAPVSIRMNTSKWRGAPKGGRRVPWCTDGYYLPVRPAFTFDPLFHAGCYYVQEAASMFLSHVLWQHVHRSVTMLDLCAAPGGKTTTALSALPEGSVVVCNEPVPRRAAVLLENVWKWGNENVIVTRNYPADFKCMAGMFDVVLCDAPCSGEGLFRKDSEAVGEWTPGAVDACAALQRSILSDAWLCLKEGGLMIFSTCTYNTEENEKNVRWLCATYGAEPITVDTVAEWGVTGSLLDGFDAPVYRFIPGRTEGEGLFMAVMRRGSHNDARPQSALPSPRRTKTDCTALLTGERDDWYTFETGSGVTAVPRGMRETLAAAAPLRLLSAGVPLYNNKGRGTVPAAALALSRRFRRDAFPTADLPYDDAVAYLQRCAVTLPPGTPDGYVAVTYRGMPVGFAKNIGRRANNLYPQEWRIKSTHAPDIQEII